MREWREKEWRIPRRGEIVRDHDGNLGRVSHTKGTLRERKIWVENVNGTEIHSEVDSEDFQIVSLEETADFQLRRYELLGYRIGTICTFKGDSAVPLEIVQMNWNHVRYAMTFCLKDLRKFNSEIMRTDSESSIPLFPEEIVPVETIFSNSDSGLKWRLEVNLVEKNRDGWASCGSPWEFLTKEDALAEVESWRSRLKIRRVSSVLAGDWSVKFPCWGVDAVMIDNIIFTRVKLLESLNGSPGYFRTAIHAARAMQIVPKSDWLNSLACNQDRISL